MAIISLAKIIARWQINSASNNNLQTEFGDYNSFHDYKTVYNKKKMQLKASSTTFINRPEIGIAA